MPLQQCARTRARTIHYTLGRSDEPGAFDGGNKFDLTRWNDAFFKRLKDFLDYASNRGVIVTARANFSDTGIHAITAPAFVEDIALRILNP